MRYHLNIININQNFKYLLISLLAVLYSFNGYSQCNQDCSAPDLQAFEHQGFEAINAANVQVGDAEIFIDREFFGSADADENTINATQTTGDLGVRLGVVNAQSFANRMETTYSFTEPVCSFSIEIWDIDQTDEMLLTASNNGSSVSFSSSLGSCVSQNANTFTTANTACQVQVSGNTNHRVIIDFDSCIDEFVIAYYDRGPGDGGSYTVVLDEGCTGEVPDAGTLTANNNCGFKISATADGNINIPAGYSSLYVLTSGSGLFIEQVADTPDFSVTSIGDYTIHTLVYDPITLDLSIVVLGQTTGFDVNGLLVQGGGSICGSLDVAGAPISVEDCIADAGTLGANDNCGFDISATADGNSNVPTGYSTIYVLTSGSGLVIEQVAATPDFTVTSTGDYTIHTLVYDANTLDLSIVVPGQTTGFDVNGLLLQGGGCICASLDVAGAPIAVEDCTADAGTLSANDTCGFSISATADGNATVPAGYSSLYVLTSGTGLVIEQVAATPDFTVTSGGDYTIHTLVYDPNTLDLSIVVPGQTTGFDVNGLLLQGGGCVCASLDVAGAPISVEDCTADAGTLTANANCSFDISATPDGNSNVPNGYSSLYVLTSGTGLVIEQVAATPDFTVTANGDYTIHTLVYDPNTLDLSIVVPGQTTGFDVNDLLIQGGGCVCASLDVAGAPITVADCTADAGTLSANDTCGFNISATADGNSTVPTGYSTIYVLTSGSGLVIEQVAATPDFTVTSGGDYTIHTLVYDANTLDLSIVVPGQTTGFDVNGLLLQGGGCVCASLDVTGAPITVDDCTADAGTLSANPVSNDVLSATPDGNTNVPAGYSVIYVLTSGSGLVIEQVAATPSFTVTDVNDPYTIHTLVYDANTLDLSIVNPGVTTGFDVNGLMIQGGGCICASLDVAGAAFNSSCPDNLTLTGNVNTASSTVAGLTINSTQVIGAGADVTYDASQCIELNPGFEVALNAAFETLLVGCN